MQLRRMSGISSLVTSRYSSREPPNSFGRPDLFIRPMRFRFGTFDLISVSVLTAESFVRALRRNSAFESSRAIRDVARMYSRIFYGANTMQ